MFNYFNRRTNKYKAIKTGDGFPSKLESAVHGILQLREKVGEIKEIKRQQLVVLQDGDKNKRITWRVDFSFIDIKTNQLIFAEAKGVSCREYLIKLRLWREKMPYSLEIWRGSYKRPYLHEKLFKQGEKENDIK